MPRGIKAPLTYWYAREPNLPFLVGHTDKKHRTEQDARREIREANDLKILPPHMEFWRKDA